VPRKRRHWIPGEGAHIISQFVDRRFFLADDPDRYSLKNAISKAQRRWDWRFLSYALMSSHVHYGVVAGSRNPDPFFRSTHTRFAQHCHKRSEGRTRGPVFADRPTIHHYRRERLSRLVAYQHRNPSEAGVVDRPADSRWTSHRIYLRLDPEPEWLDVEWALSVLGFRDTAAGRRRFDQFVLEVDLDDFVIQPRTEARRAPALRSPPAELEWGLLEKAARDLTGLDPIVPLRSRMPAAVEARWLIARVACNDLGQTYTTAGEALGMTRSAVCNLLRRKVVTPAMARREDALRRQLGSLKTMKTSVPYITA